MQRIHDLCQLVCAVAERAGLPVEQQMIAILLLVILGDLVGDYQREFLVFLSAFVYAFEKMF